MLRLSVAASILIVLASGCASSTDTGAPAVDVQIAQLPDAGFSVEDRGFVSVAYQMTVRNRSLDRITLRRVEMKTVRSSPYTLRDEPAALTDTIEAGQEAVVTFSMWRTVDDQGSTVRRLVWVTGTVQYDSAKGSFKRAFTQSFREP